MGLDVFCGTLLHLSFLSAQREHARACRGRDPGAIFLLGFMSQDQIGGRVGRRADGCQRRCMYLSFGHCVPFQIIGLMRQWLSVSQPPCAG